MKELRKEIARHGGTITGGLRGRWYRYQIEAPGGYYWSSPGYTEVLLLEWYRGHEKFKQQAIEDARERVADGVVKIDDESMVKT